MTDLQIYLLSISFSVIVACISWRFGEHKKRTRQNEAHENLNKAIEKYAKMPFIEVDGNKNVCDLTQEEQEHCLARVDVQIAIIKLRNIK